MRLRTQLLVAFLILAVLPLIAIVLYSYATSLRAFRQVVAEEADLLTREMEEHLRKAQSDLEQRMVEASQLPHAERLLAGDESLQGDEAFLEIIAGALEGVEPFVESFEFIPAPSADADGSVSWVFSAPKPDAPEAAPEPPDAPAAGVAPEDQVEDRVAETERSRVEEELALRLEEAQGEIERELEALSEPWTAQAEEGGFAAMIAATTEIALAASAAAMEQSAAELRKVEIQRIDRQRLEELAEERRRVLGREVASPVVVGDERLGTLRADVDPAALLASILGRTRRDRGEIPFALDAEGQLFVAEGDDRERLAALPLTPGADIDSSSLDNWVLGTRKDPQTGLTFGIARPIRESVEEIRRTAVRNLGWGLALVGLAVLGILPLSSRMSASLGELTRGAESLAAGHLETRVEVRTKNEVGQLAAAFNKMAHDLQEKQVQLLSEERRRREEEMDRRLLEAEHARKTRELEDARAFQLSMLPRELPRHPALDLAVHMSTATEVGGDYYDFRYGDDASMTLAVGDATGHGARAGTMVTVIKSLFAADAEAIAPADFLGKAHATIRRMHLGRMAMALAVARLEGRHLRIALAGMPPILVHRAASGDIEEFSQAALPLGSLPDATYRERSLALDEGDTLLIMSDGLPELQDGHGEPLGYDTARQLFAEAVGATAQETIDSLAAAVRSRTVGRPPSDDVTLVAVRTLA